MKLYQVGNWAAVRRLGLGSCVEPVEDGGRTAVCTRLTRLWYYCRNIDGESHGGLRYKLAEYHEWVVNRSTGKQESSALAARADGPGASLLTWRPSVHFNIRQIT